jgi:YD repeat-containing protein
MRFPARWILAVAGIGLATSSLARAQDVVVDEETGEVVREVDADGTETDVVRDEQGRIVAERRSDGTVVRYWYDSNGKRHVVDR